MSGNPQLREQLHNLSIPREQRPEAPAGASRSRGRAGLITVLVLIVLGLAGYVAWDKFGDRLGIATPEAGSAGEVHLLRVAAQQGAEAGPVLTATGKIVSDHRVQVATKVSGQIVALYFEQGDHVEANQLLARIEDVSYRARRDEAAAELEKARAAAAYQKTNFARIEGLFKEHQASDIEFADAQRARDEADAQVEADEAALAYVEKMLRDCQVVAPIAGVVLDRNVEVGDFVAAEGGIGAMANSQLATIADMTKLRVEVDVSELDIARLHNDMPCTVTPDAYKQRHYRGHVMWLDPGANYAKATVQVKVRIDEPDAHLRVEGSAQVQFLAGDATSAATTEPARIWIPAAAVLTDASGATAKVFVASEGRLHATTVTLGRREGDRVEVIAGLVEGQQIAADGVAQLKDGQALR